MNDKTPAQAADPLNNEQWPVLKADIEKAAKDWATHPNGGPMDEDLYFQFIRVMAYVIESTNILHRSPRFAGQASQAPSPSLTVRERTEADDAWIRQNDRVRNKSGDYGEYTNEDWNDVVKIHHAYKRLTAIKEDEKG